MEEATSIPIGNQGSIQTVIDLCKKARAGLGFTRRGDPVVITTAANGMGLCWTCETKHLDDHHVRAHTWCYLKHDGTPLVRGDDLGTQALLEMLETSLSSYAVLLGRA